MNENLQKRDRRSFLRDAAIATGGIIGIGARPPAIAFVPPAAQADRRLSFLPFVVSALDRGGNRRRVGPGLHHRARRWLRGDGADGGRLDSDRDGARVPRRSGVQHLRRGGGRREDHALYRGSGARGDLTVHEPGRQQPRKPRPARGAAVRNAMLAVALAKQGRVGGGEAVLEGPAGFYHAYAGNNHGELTYSFSGDTHASLDTADRQSGQGVDVPRDALPHLLVCRVQHRAHRRHGEAVRRAQHQIRGRRSRRSGAELARVPCSIRAQPSRPQREDVGDPRRGSTRFYTAYGVVQRSYPLLAGTAGPPRCSS